MDEVEEKIEIIVRKVKELLEEKKTILEEIHKMEEEIKKFTYKSEQLDDQIYSIKEKHNKNYVLIFLTFVFSHFLSDFIEDKFLTPIFTFNFEYYFYYFLMITVDTIPIISLINYRYSIKEEREKRKKLEHELGISNHNILAGKIILKTYYERRAEKNKEIQELLLLLKDLEVDLETLKGKNINPSIIEEEIRQEENSDKKIKKNLQLFL